MMLCLLTKKKLEKSVFSISPHTYHFQCSLFLPVNVLLPTCHFLSAWRTSRSASNKSSVFVYLKISFCFRFWRTVLMHWEFWVDNFLLWVLWMPFSSLLVSIWMSQVRSQLLIILMLPLYVMSCFSLATFKIFPFSLACNSLTLMCLGIDLFVFMLLEVCWAWISFCSNTRLAILSSNCFSVLPPNMSATLS